MPHKIFWMNKTNFKTREDLLYISSTSKNGPALKYFKKYLSIPVHHFGFSNSYILLTRFSGTLRYGSQSFTAYGKKYILTNVNLCSYTSIRFCIPLSINQF